jgi:hypothetical protein
VSPRARSRSRSRRARHSRYLLWLVAVAVAAFVAGGAGGFDQLRDLLAPPGGRATSDAGVDADRARRMLAELEVGEWASTAGYSRDRFAHWLTVDGCDVRQRVLVRDGEGVETDEECRAVAGTWYSPYDGVTLSDPAEVDIDHVVPLANAWRTGADRWDDDRRAAFANDLERPQLRAVSAVANRAKGDQDPSQWRPPERSYWCRYAHDWVAVKHHWGLRVTAPEKQALADMLDTCG